MNEIWKDVIGYENLYKVSNWGRVKSFRFGKERILKTFKNKDGYLQVGLWKNNKRKIFLVHRLVAQAFLDNPNNLPEVNHKDENKLNNVVSNLEWCDRTYNVNYGTAIERMIKTASKPVLQYTLDGKFVREWESTRECERNGYNHGHVASCCRGKLKKYKDSIWKYK
ncbi:MAG: NUMOD4 domain-containing protein [Mollicutes bacterium]|nr:NUMOD4 domain-containing protein [Mollicutes bacterium]